MAGPKGEECRKCYYWHNYMNEEVVDSTSCLCMIRQNQYGNFNYRTATEWCGEFKPLTEKQEGDSNES